MDCWFCEKREANPESAVEIDFQKVLRTFRRGPDLITEYDTKKIPVPRCKECENRVQKEGTHNMIGGSILLIFLAAGFLLKAIYPEFGFVSKYVFPCSGALIGATLGMVVVMRGGETKDIKPVSAALEYHTVRRMWEEGPFKHDGWFISKVWERDLNRLKEKEKDE